MSDNDRNRLAMKAISARARGDWQAERDALDAVHLIDRAEFLDALYDAVDEDEVGR